MPLPKKGLRVRWCENAAKFSKGHMRKLEAAVPSGWFIQVWYGDKWYSLMNLRFARERDAIRAAQSLTLAGLDSHGAINKAEPMLVMQIAVECLQW